MPPKAKLPIPAKHAKARVSPTTTTGGHAAPNRKASALSRNYAKPTPALAPSGVKATQPKPINVGEQAGKLVKGGVGMGVSHVKNNAAVPVLILLTFLVVALAKIKATKGSAIASLDIPKALFGGFILTLMLLLLNMWNSKLATAFAALVFVGALLEFGPSTLGTLIPAGKSAIDPSTGQYQTGLALDQTTPTGKATSPNIPAKRGTQLA